MTRSFAFGLLMPTQYYSQYDFQLNYGLLPFGDVMYSSLKI